MGEQVTGCEGVTPGWGQPPTPLCLSLGQSWHPGNPWGERGARHDGKEPGRSQHGLVALKSPGWDGAQGLSHHR